MSSLRGPGGIFISYRREETAANAGRLYDRLSDHFGEDRVFMDVDSLAYGVDFTRAVIDAVSRCDVLLALIGRDWLAITDDKGERRLDNPNDWVRVEIETALQRDIRVVPVLVDGAVLPQAHDLPLSLRPLTQRQQLELSHSGFKLEVTSLIAAVDKVLTADPVGHQPQSAAEQREAEQTAARQREAELTAARQQEAERPPAGQREAERPAPIPVVGPILLIVPLLLLAVKLLDPSYQLGSAWPVVIVCAAVLGCVAAAVESRQRKIPIWTTALEFVFVWLAVYAIYQLNVGNIHRISSRYHPVLTILAGVGAIFIGALLVRALARSARDRRAGDKRTVHPFLPVFLGCMTAGFCAVAIRYAGQRYANVEALATIGPKSSTIGGVFILAALLVSLLAPLLTLARRRRGPSASSGPR